jgi:hypothetical protein
VSEKTAVLRELNTTQTPSIKTAEGGFNALIRNTQHATRNTQHATRNTQHATRNYINM